MKKVIFIIMLSSLSFASSSCDKYINDLQSMVDKLNPKVEKSLLCYGAKTMQYHVVNILRVCTMDKDTKDQQVKNLIKLTELIDTCK